MLVIGVAAGVFVLLALPRGAEAFGESVVNGFLSLISNGLYWLASALGKFTVILFGALVQVMQYNDFINARAVAVGWVVLRDIANMLFILVLLVIGFGTAFRIQQYRYTVLLRQLILMAVLINFSKTITGFFIDFMQVIMLTFVNAFADTAAGNLTTAVGLDKVLMLKDGLAGAEVSNLSIATTLLLGVIFIAVTLVVTVLYVVVFLGRIVMLWILTILSPLAYLFNTFPATKRYWNEWWQTFWKYAMIGPILAFFLWLTLSITQAGNSVLLIDSLKSDAELQTSELEAAGAVSATISQIGSQAGMLSFGIAILLLVYSLKVASDFGVAGGKWAQQQFDKVQKTATKYTKRAALAPVSSLAATANSLASPAGMAIAGGITGLLARSPIPLANSWAARQNAKVSAARKKWEEDKTKWMEGVQDPRILAGIANRGLALTPTSRAERRKAQKLSPSGIGDFDGFVRQLQDMEMEDFKKLSPRELRRISEKFLDRDNEGKITGNRGSLATVAPEKAAWLIKEAPTTKRRASGFHTPEWRVDLNTGAPAFKTGQEKNAATGKMEDVLTPADASMRAVPDEQAGKGFDKKLLSDIDQKKFDETRRTIRDRYAGNPEAFFQSAEYKLNAERFLGRNDFLEAFEFQQERQRKIERGEQRLEELTGVGTATRKGAKGEAANLALDFEHARGLGIDVQSGMAGANLTGEQQRQAANILARKMRDQEYQKEVGRRQKELQQAADAEFEEQRVAAAKRGELGTVERRMVNQEEAAAAVAADTAFQNGLDERVGDFQSALEKAESINLINKGRTGQSARSILRHEQAHNAVSDMDPKELNAFWEELAPERRQEIESFIRSNWQNGQQLSLKQIQEEFFTEVMANTGRSKRLGPLGLNMEDRDKFLATQKTIDERHLGNVDAFYKSKEYRENPTAFLQQQNYLRAATEEEMLSELSHVKSLNAMERARASVGAIPDDRIHVVWDMLPKQRQQELEAALPETSDHMEYLKRGSNRDKYDATRQVIDERYQGNERAFFDSDDYRRNRKTAGYLTEQDYKRGQAELRAAQKDILGEMLASYEGDVKGPIAFNPDEQDLALLLRASGSGKRPATSVGDYGRPSAPPIAAAPAGSRGVTTPAPEPPGSRGFEAPISPVVQTSVINNTTVQSEASDLYQKIGSRVEAMPSRQELHYGLQQLQNIVLQVAREQGITEREIQQLTGELSRLKSEALSQNRSRRDNEQLQKDVRSFLRRLQGKSANVAADIDGETDDDDMSDDRIAA